MAHRRHRSLVLAGIAATMGSLSAWDASDDAGSTVFRGMVRFRAEATCREAVEATCTAVATILSLDRHLVSSDLRCEEVRPTRLDAIRPTLDFTVPFSVEVLVPEEEVFFQNMLIDDKSTFDDEFAARLSNEFLDYNVNTASLHVDGLIWAGKEKKGDSSTVFAASLTFKMFAGALAVFGCGTALALVAWMFVLCLTYRHGQAGVDAVQEFVGLTGALFDSRAKLVIGDRVLLSTGHAEYDKRQGIVADEQNGSYLVFVEDLDNRWFAAAEVSLVEESLPVPKRTRIFTSVIGLPSRIYGTIRPNERARRPSVGQTSRPSNEKRFIDELPSSWTELQAAPEALEAAAAPAPRALDSISSCGSCGHACNVQAEVVITSEKKMQAQKIRQMARELAIKKLQLQKSNEEKPDAELATHRDEFSKAHGHGQRRRAALSSGFQTDFSSTSGVPESIPEFYSERLVSDDS